MGRVRLIFGAALGCVADDFVRMAGDLTLRRLGPTCGKSRASPLPQATAPRTKKGDLGRPFLCVSRDYDFSSATTL